MRAILFVLCEGVVIDARSNRMSVFNLSDTLNAGSFPVSLPPISIVAWLEKEKGDAENNELQTVWHFNGKKAATLPMTANFQGRARTRAIAEVAGLILTEPGSLEIQLRSGTKRLGLYKMRVANVGSPTIESGARVAGKTTSDSRTKKKRVSPA